MDIETKGNQQPGEAPVLDEASRDRAEVMNGIIDQLQATYEGYDGLVDTINDGRSEEDTVDTVSEADFAGELEEWLTDEKLDYIAEQMRENPDLKFTLSAVPNVQYKDAEEITDLARKLKGEPRKRKVSIDNIAYRGYTPEELTGASAYDDSEEDENSIIFTLTPNEGEVLTIVGSGYSQHKRIRELASEHSFLKPRSVLETIGFWQRLDSSGESLLTSLDGQKREDTATYGGGLKTKRWEGRFPNPKTGIGKGMYTTPRLFVTESDTLGEIVYVDYQTHAGAKIGPIVISD